MKIVVLSDTHNFLPDPAEIPECDVVCLAGDIVPLDYQDDDIASVAWFCLDFVPWTDKLPCKKVIFIGGNHDFFLEHIMFFKREDGTIKRRTPNEVLKKLLPGNNKGKHKLIYLCDNSVDIEGKRFYGTPWVGDLSGWAFYKSDPELAEQWSIIPKKLDVLITHMPPKCCDMGMVHEAGWNYGRDFGSQELYDAMMGRDIHYTFCGHVHSGNHTASEYKPGCFVTNVSYMDEGYRPTNFPAGFPVYEI